MNGYSISSIDVLLLLIYLVGTVLLGMYLGRGMKSDGKPRMSSNLRLWAVVALAIQIAIYALR